VDHFSTNWLEFGKRFLPSGVQWLVVRARAQAQLGQVDSARQTLARIAELPAFKGLRPEKSDEYSAAAMDIALQANDLAAAQAAFVNHGSSELPTTFDLGFLQFSMARAALELRMDNAQAAQATAETALAHLHQRAGQNEFPYWQADLRRIRDAARLRMPQP
jgi:hypothetical protein